MLKHTTQVIITYRPDDPELASALSLDATIDQVISIPNAISKITAGRSAIGATLDAPAIIFTVDTYDDVSLSHRLCTSEYVLHPDYSPGAATLYAQGYAYLKTLPEFAGAEDID